MVPLALSLFLSGHFPSIIMLHAISLWDEGVHVCSDLYRLLVMNSSAVPKKNEIQGSLSVPKEAKKR